MMATNRGGRGKIKKNGWQLQAPAGENRWLRKKKKGGNRTVLSSVFFLFNNNIKTPTSYHYKKLFNL
jgi:hypothetical protein